MNGDLERVRRLAQRAYLSFGEFPEPAMEALELAKKINHTQAIAECRFVLGQALALRGRSREAFPLLEEAAVAFDQMENDDDIQPAYRGAVHTALGIVYDDWSEYESACEHHQKAYDIATRIGDHFGQQRGLLNLGYVSYKLGLGEKSIHYLLQSLKHPTRHPVLVGGAHEHMADILEQQGFWGMVLEHRQKAMESLAAVDTIRRTRVRCGIAYALHRTGETDKAWQTIRQTTAEIAHIRQPIREHGKIQLVTGWLHLSERNFDEAWKACRKALEISKDCGSSQYVDDGLLLKAEIEREEGAPSASLATCDMLEQRSMSFHRRNALRVIREKLACEMGDWFKAYRLQKETAEIQRTDLRATLLKHEELFRYDLANQHNLVLLAKNQQLKKLSDERDELMHLVVHKLNNYLQVTHGSVELIEMTMNHDNTRPVLHDELIRRVKASAGVAQEVLSQLKILWDLESDPNGAVPLRRQPVKSILERVIEEHQGPAAAKSQRIVDDWAGPPVECNISDLHLELILSNLLSNAIKFAYEQAETRVTARQSGDDLIIQVRDQGQGMTADDLSQVFQRFKRLSARPTAHETSNCLGLFLSRKLAEAMKGSLNVVSEGKDKGCTFTLKLPIARQGASRPS